MSIAGDAGGAERAFGPWKATDFEAFAAAYGGTTISKTKARMAIYAQGDPADSLFYICAGQVRIRLVSPQGKMAIMATLEHDALFGETCLLGESVRVATAVCLTDCVLVRIAKANAIRALQSDPRFAGFLLMRVMHRARRLRARLISHLFESSEQRLARILLMLANCGGDRDETIVDKLDQEDLAQMVGTTRARISHFMNKFRNLGYIDYDGDIAVHRSLSHVLAAEFGNPEDAIENL